MEQRKGMSVQMFKRIDCDSESYLSLVDAVLLTAFFVLVGAVIFLSSSLSPFVIKTFRMLYIDIQNNQSVPLYFFLLAAFHVYRKSSL